MLIFGTCCILYYVTHSFYSFLFILHLHFGGSLMLIKLLMLANGQQNVLSGRSCYANRKLQTGSKLNVCIYFLNNSAL